MNPVVISYLNSKDTRATSIDLDEVQCNCFVVDMVDILLYKVVSEATVQDFNKFDNCSHLPIRNFRSAFVSILRFSITFDFSKTSYLTVLLISSYVHSYTT